jgi:hypothetical protein
MRYIWDGRGTAGASAECAITHDEIRLQPRKAIRTSLGWPAVVLPRKEVRGVERMLFGRYRFRSDREVLDGACFRPIGSKDAFLAALRQVGIPITIAPLNDKLAFEFRRDWNQMRWEERLRRRDWDQQRQEGASE